MNAPATPAHCPIASAEAAEYYRARDYVLSCRRSGYHAPYNNHHSDAGLGDAYERGFRDGLEATA